MNPSDLVIRIVESGRYAWSDFPTARARTARCRPSSRVGIPSWRATAQNITSGCQLFALGTSNFFECCSIDRLRLGHPIGAPSPISQTPRKEIMSEPPKVARHTIQWVAAWLLTLAGLAGMCATSYKNAYLIALWVIGMLVALIWMPKLRMSKARTSDKTRI